MRTTDESRQQHALSPRPTARRTHAHAASLPWMPAAKKPRRPDGQLDGDVAHGGNVDTMPRCSARRQSRSTRRSTRSRDLASTRKCIRTCRYDEGPRPNGDHHRQMTQDLRNVTGNPLNPKRNCATRSPHRRATTAQLAAAVAWRKQQRHGLRCARTRTGPGAAGTQDARRGRSRASARFSGVRSPARRTRRAEVATHTLYYTGSAPSPATDLARFNVA